MKRRFLFLAISFLSSFSFGQLTIESSRNSGDWADYYVNDVLLGAGVVAFNITFNGCDTTVNGVGVDSNQIAEYTSNTSTVGIPYGVMLSSGSTEEASPSSPNPPFGPGFSDNAGDADLAQIVTSTLHNRAVLEFDFVPQGDSIKFDYVFGSQEYPGFVCSNFNDVFGFFLSGPGITGPYTNGAVNLALVPGTNTEVAINTINDVAGGASCPAPGCPCNSQYFVNNYTPPTDTNNNINGLTTKLRAEYAVNCGDTYHIKLAIADAGDGSLDSYVFLEGGSFSSNIVEVNITSVNGDSTINEGCGTAEIQFFRSDTTDTSYTPIIISGTATNGVDFTLVPDTIVMFPGVEDTVIVIDPFNDGLTEGMEFITITAVSVNPCGDTFYSTGTLYFFDVPQINAQYTDTVFRCPEPNSVVFDATILGGGPPPFTYNWSTGDTTASTTFLPIQTNGFDTIYIAIQDSCALYTQTDTIVYERNVAPPPLVTALPQDTTVACAGDTVTLAYGAINGSGNSVLYWSTNDTLPSIDVEVNGTSQYIINMLDSCNRLAMDTVDVSVMNAPPLEIQIPDSNVYCPGDSIYLEATFSGGSPDYSFSWQKTPIDYLDSTFKGFVIPGDTFVYVSVQDECGRTTLDSAFVEVEKVDPLSVQIQGQSVPCSGVEVMILPQVSGGSVPLSYEWSTGDTTFTTEFEVTVDELIRLKVFDFCGRLAEDTTRVTTPEFENLELILGGDLKLCYGDSQSVFVEGTGGAGGYSFDWLTLNPLGSEVKKTDSSLFLVTATESGTHLITVRDFCGNTTTDSVYLEVDPCVFIPNVITPNGDGNNDAFVISNVNNIPNTEVAIYNRWGQRIYFSENYLNDWFPNKHPSGTYFYVVRSTVFPELRGTVTVIND